MSPIASSSSTLAAQPLWLPNQSLAVRCFAVLLGTLVLAASSHVSVPMFPVPMTMQTLAVTLVGALYGWRLGGLTILAWLAEGALGLPVFASGTGGIARFFGPTAGYLLAFPIAGAVTGWLVERGWNGQRVLRAFAAMLIGNALCLLIGGAWLSAMIGVTAAVASGVAPFVLGAVLKSVLGAALLKALSLAPRQATAG